MSAASSGGPSSRFPRPDYAALTRYDPGRSPVEVDLSDNTNLWGAHPAAVRVLREATVDGLARYPHLYADDLKAAAARRAGVDAEHVTTGCGSDDILDSAFRAAASTPGLVRFAGPSFSMVEPFARMNGHQPAEVPWSRALDDPARLLEDDPVLLYLCRPNNPTGEVAPLPWLQELLRASEARGDRAPLVLLDEAYADFAGEDYLAEAPAHPRLLVIRTLSKAYGLAGLRVGWAVGGDEAVGEVEKSRGPYKVARLAETAAAAALDDAEGWAADIVRMVIENRERLADALRARRFTPLPSRANFLLVPVPEGTAADRSGALRRQGVQVRPFPGCADIGDALRVTVGPWPLMERFLEALDEITPPPGDARENAP